MFLFFAILAFNPLRNRLQNLVDRLFDRDRGRYREAVREHLRGDGVDAVAVRRSASASCSRSPDSMGVERAMVLLLDEESRAVPARGARGAWDEDESTGFALPVDHPICEAPLDAAPGAVARATSTTRADPDTREACWDVFDTLDVALLVPILFGVDLLGVIAVGRKISGERLAAGRPPAAAHARQPERDRDRERARPSTRSRSSTRRSRRASTSARASCATRRRS